MIIGSNAAENHPLSFKWVTEAMEKGAKLISVDPRFTRTSSKADIYARMRSGTDIAFIGGMIKYVIEDIENHPENYNMTYIKQCQMTATVLSFNLDIGICLGFRACDLGFPLRGVSASCFASGFCSCPIYWATTFLNYASQRQKSDY